MLASTSSCSAGSPRRRSQSCARGQHEDVAGADLEALADLRPAEDHGGAAGGDAEDLVRRAVEVVEVEDAAAPRVAPAVGVEELLAAGGTGGDCLDVVVDEHRQRAVGDRAV